VHTPLKYISAQPMKIKVPHWHLPRETEANHECLLKIRWRNEIDARTSRIQRRNANANYKSILFGEIKRIKVHYYITKTNKNYHYYLGSDRELFSPCIH